MTEPLLDNVPENQVEQQTQDPAVIPNGTTPVAASADHEGEEGVKGQEQGQGEATEHQAPKGDLISPDQSESQVVENGPQVEVTEGAAPTGGEADSTGGTESHPETATNDNVTRETESVALSTPIIHDLPLADSHPSQSSPLVRAATPSSRTSTPPLGSSAMAKKKFSSVNVNQKFLSKAASPAPTAGPTKISTLNGRPTASPVPTVSTSSRLLSTKLTTVPTSKSSTSPNPSGPTPASSSSSPWAKPAIPAPSSVESTSPAAVSATLLHQPAPMRARVLGSTTTPPVMGTGLGLAAPPKPAWKSLTGDAKKPGLGISRDFPTAKEVAEGKKAAQMAAQAQAAHNQAILQGLNAFTQLDPNSHRWDEEDEEDDVIDFGDGMGEHHHDEHHIEPSSRASQDQPVTKSERFAEDFDRSWPRRAPAPIDREQGDHLSRRVEGDNARTLFNASSNRLEPSRHNQQPQPPIQPTRLVSRPSDLSARQPPPHVASARGGLDRAPPPHLQGAPQTDDRRSLPPHMAGTGLSSQVRPPPGPSAAPPPTRPVWGQNRDVDRAPPPHLAERRELPPQSAVFEQSRSPEKPFTNLPPRRSFSQTVGPAHPQAPVPTAPSEPLVSPSVGVDTQSAEMHSAAEKAKLRRLAEEAEREAAAERARRKAKELEERLKVKAGPSEIAAVNTSQPPTAIPQSTPQITLATRPKPPQEEAPRHPVSNVPPLPSRPDMQQQPNQLPNRNTDSSWRSRAQPPYEPAVETHPPAPTTILSSAESHPRLPRPTAESFFETSPEDVHAASFLSPHEANHPKKEANFDSMLARLQAAMAQARAAPPHGEESIHDIAFAQGPSSISREEPVSPVKYEKLQPALNLVQEYFDVTYPEPPKSPPPAWRTYTVRLPKANPPRPPISRAQLRALDAPRPAAPAGFAMSFDPSLESLLLPQPVLRRFQRFEPIVSISPRKLERFEKKSKKKSAPGPVDVAPRVEGPPRITPEESLLPSASTLKSQQLRDQRARTDEWRQAEPSVTVADKPKPPTTDPAEVPPRKTKSPVKKSAAAKAEREGRFATDGVTIGVPERDRAALADKPGVRFMVSSELEGDSLLDEVNKMSLETLGEGDEKDREGPVGEPLMTSDAEAPKTPPVPRPSSPNTSSWPKVPLSYPASHSPARSVTQHDHDAIKSVWDAQQTALKQSAEMATPMYPSLNAPSSSDPPAAQPLPGSMKMTFSQSQTFSSPGIAGPSLSAPNSYNNLHRTPSAHTPYGQYGSPQSVPSPDVQPHNMMGLNYSSMSNPRTGTNGFQQGVWSPTAFGTSMASSGYGYGAQKPSMDPKSPAAMGYTNNGKAPEAMAYAGYQSAYPQQQQQQGQQQPQQQQQYAAPGYGRGVNSNHSNMYGYGYGAPGQQVRPATGRFAQANGDYPAQAQTGQYHMTEGGQGGYYGGVNTQGMYPATAYQHGQQGHGAVGQGGRGMGAARKMW